MKLHPLTLTETDPEARGRAIGSRFADEVRTTSALYLAHFARKGIPHDRVRAIVDACLGSLGEWSPALAAETRALAAAAGLEPWQVAAVAARTEVLATAPAVGECTTAVRVPRDGPPETIQTWDWHDDLVPDALLLGLTTEAGRRVKVFTEFGAPAKIGLNDAGLGLHFNILNHRGDDASGGVPVHAVARQVLEEATTVAEAEQIARSARVSASTVLTVVTCHEGRADAASIELSPAGVGVVRAGEDGWLLHTNHFLDPVLAAGDAVTAAAFSFERLAHAASVRAGMPGLTAAERAAAFCGAAGDDAAVCVARDASLPLQEQWETLLTVSLDLPGFAIDHRVGTPAAVEREGLERF